jgi:hypothetical protein
LYLERGVAARSFPNVLLPSGMDFGHSLSPRWVAPTPAISRCLAQHKTGGYELAAPADVEAGSCVQMQQYVQNNEI